MIECEELAIPGVKLFRPKRFSDSRGFFQEIFSDKYDFGCQQINLSKSKKNAIRGLHCAPFSKVCTCIKGSLYDVIVDLRDDSETYKKWIGVWLDENKPTQVHIPPGCGHGFYSAEEDSCLLYFQNDVYRPDVEKYYYYDDFNIVWPEADEYILSEKDKNAPLYKFT